MSRCLAFLKQQNLCLCLCCSACCTISMKNAAALAPILLFVFVLLHLTYWNSSFSLLSRLSSFTLTIKEKYSDMIDIPIYISVTFLQHIATKLYQEKKTPPPLCCSVFIHLLHAIHAFIKHFKAACKKVCWNASTSACIQVCSREVWVVSELCLQINFYLLIIYILSHQK